MLLSVFITAKPLLSLASKVKLFSLSYILDSESEEDSKSKTIEEEADSLLYSQFFSLHSFSTNELTCKVVAMTIYLLNYVDFPLVQQLQIPPEL